MEQHKGYFEKILPTVLATILVALTFVLVLLLNGAAVDSVILESVILALQIVGFFLTIYLILAWVQYQRERTAREENAHLQTEIAALKEQALRTHSEMQDYFLMWVHQIKTPITVAKLIVDTMEHEQTKHKLMQELLAIETYSNMAMNYLKLSQANPDMDISEINIDEVIRPLLRKYSIVFIRNHIRLEYEPIGVFVITDANWLSVLIEQLLSNAAKYTSHGVVGIRFRHKENTLEIYDTGIGIRKEDIPRIFEKGYSGFNGRANQKSSGLGLFLAKKIAKKLNLKIDVTSKPNQGSCFTIQFPHPNLTNL